MKYWLLKIKTILDQMIMCPHYNDGHNILRLFDTLPFFFFSPQVKRSVVISNKHGRVAERFNT